MPSKPLDAEQVHRLQVACDELFGMKLRLIDFLTDGGLLCIQSVAVGQDTYRAACIGHELFGMWAVDEAHGCPVYPTENWTVPDVETFAEQWRSWRKDWDESQIREKAESDFYWLSSQRRFEQETQELVKSFAKRWRYLA